ncbi:MAG TPA: hypothetical protein VH186_08240 [Chloroflexia bacterium]|nr:hypothetical protein [Chloroflexia bacterium]
MNFITQRLKTIIVLAVIVASALIFAWLFYLNGNFDRTLSAKTSQVRDDSGAWARAIGDNNYPASASGNRPRQPLATASATRQADYQPQPDELESLPQDAFVADWTFSTDPDTARALKALSSNGPGAQAQAAINGLSIQFQPGLYNPIGRPTITFDTFLHFLKEGNSPAVPEATAMYALCVRELCDPAVALAFFQHESSMGTQGAAARNKSFGNIRCTPGSMCNDSGGNGSFKAYNSWTEGLLDWVRLVRDTYGTQWHLYTIEQIIPRYAPSSDNNNPSGYINSVKSLVNKYRSYCNFCQS